MCSVFGLNPLFVPSPKVGIGKARVRERVIELVKYGRARARVPGAQPVQMEPVGSREKINSLHFGRIRFHRLKSDPRQNVDFPRSADRRSSLGACAFSVCVASHLIRLDRPEAGETKDLNKEFNVHHVFGSFGVSP